MLDVSAGVLAERWVRTRGRCCVGSCAFACALVHSEVCSCIHCRLVLSARRELLGHRRLCRMREMISVC